MFVDISVPISQEKTCGPLTYLGYELDSCKMESSSDLSQTILNYEYEREQTFVNIIIVGRRAVCEH